MTRKALIAGNWKMHMTREEAANLAKALLQHLPSSEDREVLIAPPFTALDEVARHTTDTPILLAGQNVCWEEKGAYTGEISPLMLKNCGASFAIVGHSERRQIFGETDTLINKRLLGGLAYGLNIILCIGETLDERESDKTFSVLQQQLETGLNGVRETDCQNIVIAYEPVWAIGTGKTATKEQAQEVHAFIRQNISKIFKKDIAEAIRIVYGGSVKPTNIDELMSQPDIDGALVGGAALKSDSFGKIINFIK